MSKADNSRFIGALGFLGFLGFLGTESYQHLARFALLSTLSDASLLVLIPIDESKVRAPIDPKKKQHLGFLGFLGFLGSLAGPNPGIAGLAGWHGCLVWSCGWINDIKMGNIEPAPRSECSRRAPVKGALPPRRRVISYLSSEPQDSTV